MTYQLNELLVHNFTGKIYKVVDQSDTETCLRHCPDGIYPAGQTTCKPHAQVESNYKRWEAVA